MGQGYYTAIVWGAILDEETYVEYEEILEEYALNSKRFKTSYESFQHWIGFMVGDSDGNINTRYEPFAEDRFPQIGLCFYRQTFPLSEMEERIGVNTIEEAKNLWNDFNRFMIGRGLTLPDPCLLFVNDFH